MATEKEKMLAGELYYGLDNQLCQERLKCKKIIKKFNDAEPEELEKRDQYLRQLFGHFGKGAYIEPPFHCDYGYNISIGDRTGLNYHAIILDECPVKIGEDCLFGPYCKIITATHPLDSKVRKNYGPEYAKPITIGDDCFFGANCTVLPGVTIGDRVVVGAGSVVTKDIPSDTVVCGNPARLLKKLAKL